MQHITKKPTWPKIALFLIIAIALLLSGCSSPDVHIPTATPTTTISPSPTPTAAIESPTPTATVAPSPTVSPTAYPVNSGGDSNTLTVYFIDVGQGDSILLRKGDRAMLIDGGPTSAGSTVASFLQEHGVSTIDVLVSTHPHEDHIGGLLTVLNQFPVRQVVDSGQVHTSQTYENYLTIIDQKDIPYRVAERGGSIDFAPGVTVDILSPPSSPISSDDLNQNSIVLKVTHGSIKFLFMGDAGTDAENSIMASGADLKADILKVAHHGSKYASGSSFLSKVKPSVSVIEVGSGNSYGHPASETLNRISAVGSTIYRTDQNSDVTITSDGNTYTVTAERGSASSPQGAIAPSVAPAATNGGLPNVDYIGNSNTKKFHLSTCRYVSSIAPDHVVHFSSRDEAISQGYVPCKVCNP